MPLYNPFPKQNMHVYLSAEKLLHRRLSLGLSYRTTMFGWVYRALWYGLFPTY